MTDIGRKLAALEARIQRIERASRLSSAALDDTALEVRDTFGGLRAILGVQADGTTAVNIVNGPPPPAPSAPVVASVLGGVTVSWDGTFAGGAVAPLDWSRVEAHAAAVAGFEPGPDTLRTTIETAQGSTVVVPCTGDVYVRLVARNTSGSASVPSVEAGPLGPAPVVSTEILDGIVTTVKLADDAVTQAKIAAGAVGTTTLVAGAVQAGKIAADAVQAGNIAANAVTAREIAALAVTADKIDANAITASKIQAGAVDATALAADAITGKTITGGSINGTTVTGGLIRTATSGERVLINDAGSNKIHIYDSAGTLVGEFGSGGVGIKGPSGNVVALNPATTNPQVRWQNASNTKIANIQAVTSGTGELNILLVNSIGNSLSIEEGFSQLIGGRLRVFPPANTNAGLYVEADPAHTGNLAAFVRDGAYRFTVDKDGNTAVSGMLTAGNITSGRASITPTAANTPTSINVTGLNLLGSNIRVIATPSTAVPGTQVLGVGTANVTNTGFTLWLTRTNTTATSIDWIAIGS
ncbi:hypothetical protein [Streptomyces sp. AD55]|uniref:hypothetical protein n=1 Tax=Streptomyces sp. AD55 TaxID=3242895 RepID=UPI003528531C